MFRNKSVFHVIFKDVGEKTTYEEVIHSLCDT